LTRPVRILIVEAYKLVNSKEELLRVGFKSLPAPGNKPAARPDRDTIASRTYTDQGLVLDGAYPKKKSIHTAVLAPGSNPGGIRNDLVAQWQSNTH